MRRSILLCLGVPLLGAANSPNPKPEEILADAQRYTVKIQVQNEIAFNQDEAGSASGTGFLIDRERGWLLTNAHVATRSPSVVKVSFKGGQPIVAKRIHVDPIIDLAVLAIPVSAIPETAAEAPLACESTPVAGTSVMAFGHPWGMSYTASRGIVSGLAWFYPSLMIQTDAVINSGNSGGPLISLVDGRVIGINTSTYQPDEGEGGTAISLAEPMHSVCRIVELLRKGADSDVRLDDHIVSVDGREFRTVEDLYSYLAKLPEDAEVELVLIRATAAAEFYREYSRITLSRKKLEWISAE